MTELMERMDYYSVKVANETLNARLRETNGGLIFTIIKDNYVHELIDIAFHASEAYELIIWRC